MLRQMGRCEIAKCEQGCRRLNDLILNSGGVVGGLLEIPPPIEVTDFKRLGLIGFHEAVVAAEATKRRPQESICTWKCRQLR